MDHETVFCLSACRRQQSRTLGQKNVCMLCAIMRTVVPAPLCALRSSLQPFLRFIITGTVMDDFNYYRTITGHPGDTYFRYDKRTHGRAV